MPKVALANVLIFDGTAFRGPETVVIDGGVIGTDENGAEMIDCTGCTLLPGFIDCHIHIDEPEHLDEYIRHGITTVLDLGSADDLDPFRSRQNTAQYRGVGLPAFSPTSQIAAMFQQTGFATESAAVEFVEKRVAEKSDYIKIIADEPGFTQDVLNKIVATAAQHNKLSLAHALHFTAFQRAVQGGANVVTHVPMDKPVDEATATMMATQGTMVIPTLVMVEKLVHTPFASPGAKFDNGLASLATMHKAGVRILAGTDSNTKSPMPVPIGASFYRELELLIEAGLSATEALQAATSLPAKYLGLGDRGAITPGLRADVVLVEGDVSKDIQAVRNTKRVWTGGFEFQLEAVA